MKKRRGHGWTRRKSHLKTFSVGKVSVSIAPSQISVQSVNQASRSRNPFLDPIHIPTLSRGISIQESIDVIRRKIIEDCNWHTLACHYLGDSQDCFPCIGVRNRRRHG
jgi:hypothetical protein